MNKQQSPFVLKKRALPYLNSTSKRGRQLFKDEKVSQTQSVNYQRNPNKFRLFRQTINSLNKGNFNISLI